MRLVICVSLRTAASAQAPSTPMSLSSRLQGVGTRPEMVNTFKKRERPAEQCGRSDAKVMWSVHCGLETLESGEVCVRVRAVRGPRCAR